MADMHRIRSVRRNGENISLNSHGEIVGTLDSFKGRLKSDLRYLDEVGLVGFRKIFRQSRKDEIPYNKPANVLKRSVYTLGRQLIDLRKEDVLAEYLQTQAKAAKAPLISEAAPKAKDNPFFWFYHLLLCENRSPQSAVRLISRDQLSKSARQLVYAHRNDVPPEYLIGFILQIGGDPMLDLYSQKKRYGWKTAKRVNKQKITPVPNTHSADIPS